MTDQSGIRGSVAVVGTGLAGIGEAHGRTHLEIIGEAVHKALDEAGLKKDDIDGLFTANMQNVLPSLTVGEYLRIYPKVTDGTNVGGSSFLSHLQSAALAINAGLCNVALICYGANLRTLGGKYSSPAETPPFEAPYKPRHPISGYALAAARYMHQYGATREHLAHVAVSARKWANMNPDAFAKGDLSVDDVLGARMVCDPLSVMDCCLVTDGAGAIILTRSDRAKDMPKKPAFLLGVAGEHWHRQISELPDLTVTAAAGSGPRAFAMAGLSPKDVDVVQVYDAFTINTLLFLEDLGFVTKGEAGPFVADGHISPGGSLPVNTNGGGLSCVHPGMYGIFLLIEAVRQLRGECGERQINGAEIALAHGNGGQLSSQVTAILGTDAAL